MIQSPAPIQGAFLYFKRVENSKGEKMKELPIPTYPLSPIALPKWFPQFKKFKQAKAKTKTIFIAAAPQKSKHAGIEVHWAKNLDEVREAQRLRYLVFATEMGARLNTSIPGHDVDLFDDYCEHLLVRHQATGEVIGTYRVLTPAQAKRVGGTYSDQEFDLVRLRGLRERMVELGRSCVHPDHRHGGVIMALWGALTEFMVRNQLDTMIGCASIPMMSNGVVSGDAAASIWNQLSKTHLAPIEFQVRPRLPLPVEELDGSLAVEPPALIKGYLRLGAKVLGAPAWDPDFNCADLPMLMRIQDLPSRYRKHFIGAQ
jgi:putative hemolysin